MRSNKLLQLDIPEELINMLSDSKDMLEDPNSKMNYFDLEENEKIVIVNNGQTTASAEGGINIETPAFGKKKTPSLAMFKGNSQIHNISNN